jgi:phosphoglycolate phosphatase-like HAD superfamily hydrolase
MLIIDFDYTIFDAMKFRKDLAKVFGLSFYDFNKFYFSEFKNKKINYSISRHLQILKNQGRKVQNNNFKREADELFTKIDNYLFDGVEKFLKECQKRGFKIVMLTFGDKLWQKKKINSSKIKQYFDQIIITDINKAAELSRLKSVRGKVIIINDNAKEMMMLNNFFKQARTFLLKGPYSYNIKHNYKAYNLNFFKKDIV